MNARQLQPGTRYRLPAVSRRAKVMIDVHGPIFRFVRRTWSAAQSEHWFLFVAGTGREVWLRREDIAGCEVEELKEKWAVCCMCGWVERNEELPRDDGPHPHACGKDECPDCGHDNCICCCLTEGEAWEMAGSQGHQS